jgi:hypothetical protein
MKERQIAHEKTDIIYKLEDEIKLSEESHETTKGQYAELEVKLRQIETRSM